MAANAPIHDYEVLTAASNSPSYNYGLREHKWYGLWTRELRNFEHTNHFFLYPQYTLYIRERDGSEFLPSPSSQIGYSHENKKSSILVSARITRSVYTAPGGLAPISAFTQLEPSPEIVSARDGHGDALINNETSRVYKRTSALGTPDQIAADPRTPKTPSTPSTTADDDEDPQLSPYHRIPDFAICFYRFHRNPVLRYSERPNIFIERRVIPVLVEIKSYQCEGNNHDSFLSMEEVNTKLIQAINDVTEQVTYLFSPLSVEERQSAVIAIAASGFFWCWTQFLNRDGQLIHNMALSENAVVDHWSRRYEIRTQESTAMFISIRNWVGGYVNNLNNIQPPIIQEP